MRVRTLLVGVAEAAAFLAGLLAAFAGAKRPIILKLNSQVTLIKGNRFSVGGNQNVEPVFDIHYFDFVAILLVYRSIDNAWCQRNPLLIYQVFHPKIV